MSTDVSIALPDKGSETEGQPPCESTPEARSNVRRIIAGLVSGRRPGHRPMPDTEFLRWCDPDRYRHEQFLLRLDHLTNLLIEALDGGQPLHQEPRKPALAPSPKAHSGAIDL